MRWRCADWINRHWWRHPRRCRDDLSPDRRSRHASGTTVPRADQHNWLDSGLRQRFDQSRPYRARSVGYSRFSRIEKLCCSCGLRVGDIGRFRSTAAFATYTGTAPIEVSSGGVTRHRLSRAGNRQLNYCLHVMAIIQARQDTPGRAYYLRKRSEGKSHNEALRCLKRRLSDRVYRQLIHDTNTQKAGPGGHSGAALSSRAACGCTATSTRTRWRRRVMCFSAGCPPPTGSVDSSPQPPAAHDARRSPGFLRRLRG